MNRVNLHLAMPGFASTPLVNHSIVIIACTIEFVQLPALCDNSLQTYATSPAFTTQQNQSRWNKASSRVTGRGYHSIGQPRLSIMQIGNILVQS